MADNRATVGRNNEIVATLEADGLKGPDMTLGGKYLFRSAPKFHGKKRANSNSGGTGRVGRVAKRAKGSPNHVTARFGKST